MVKKKKEMDKVQKVIVMLLVVAIVFSIASVFFNFALIDFDSIQSESPSVSGNTKANINLVVVSNELNSEGSGNNEI